MVGHRGEPQLIERVRRVGHELAEKHVSVAVEGVDDEVEEAVDLGLVLVRLAVGAARGRGLFGRSLRADDDGGEPAMLGGERDGGMDRL